MCRVLAVSTSGYYAWRNRTESHRDQQSRRLVVEIKALHAESRQSYGSPRIHDALNERGLACGKHRVARLMRLHGIKAKQRRSFKRTTDSNHALAVADNVLDRHFARSGPNQAWAADITYISTREGWLYLAVVMDLYSRRIIGWSMKPTRHRQLVLDALKMALQQRGATVIHHSDRGRQYASDDYQRLLHDNGIVGSMSRRGNCWDNAPVESFFASLKREWIPLQYRTRAEARSDIFAYLEVWYNRKRRHSSLGYLSPAGYEEAYYRDGLSIAA